MRLRPRDGVPRAAFLRCRSLPPAFLLPERDLSGLGRRDHATPASWALPRLEEHGGTELSRQVGGHVDLVDLDVGQPDRVLAAALNDSTPEIVAEFEREVRTVHSVDRLSAPAAQRRIESAGADQVGGMQLEVYDGATRDRSRHADCSLSRPRVRGDHTAESHCASRSAPVSPNFERAITSRAISMGSINRDPLTCRNPTRGRGDLSVEEASAFTNRGGSAVPHRRERWISRRDWISICDRAECTNRGHRQISGLSAIREGSATYW